MNSKPFAHKVLLQGGGIVGVSTVLIVLLVVLSMTRYTQQVGSDRLAAAHTVAEQLLTFQRERLWRLGATLAAEPGFSLAALSADAEGLSAFLAERVAKIGADFLLVFDPRTLKVTGAAGLDRHDAFFQAASVSKGLAQAARDAQADMFWLNNGRLYRVAVLAVPAPTMSQGRRAGPEVMQIAVGLEVGSSFLRQFQTMTQLDIALFVQAGADVEPVPVPVQSAQAGAQVLATLAASTREPPSFFKFLTQDVVTQRVTLQSGEALTLEGLLSLRLGPQGGALGGIHYDIVGVMLLMLVGLIFVVSSWARTLIVPLNALTAWAGRLAEGDYDRHPAPMASGVAELNQLVRSFSQMQRDIADREQKIRFQAQHDLLTQLLNRFSIIDVIEQRLAKGQPFQLVAISVADFQGLNNVFGFQNGDKVLASLAARVLRLGGQAARLNGGELLWIPEQSQSAEALLAVVERLDRAHLLGGLSVTARTVVGELWAPRDGDSAETLLRRASIVLDHAEHHAQRCLPYQTSMEEDYLKRLEMIGQLKRALTTHQSEFSICYQPKVFAKTRQVFKAEALARWTNEKLGWVAPDQFIGIAEQAGLIGVLTECVINRVILDLQRWRAEGVTIQVAINLSVTDIVNPQLLPTILRCLDEADLPVDSLSFEITESELMEEPEAALAQLSAFRQAGFSLAIDDFGTGYSSLAYLKSLPVTELKIDKSFVMKLDSDDDDQKIVQSIIALAKQFGLTLVAEGVENVTAMEMLEQWHCDWLQGFYLCRPLPESEFVDWLSHYQALEWARVS